MLLGGIHILKSVTLCHKYCNYHYDSSQLAMLDSIWCLRKQSQEIQLHLAKFGLKNVCHGYVIGCTGLQILK